MVRRGALRKLWRKKAQGACCVCPCLVGCLVVCFSVLTGFANVRGRRLVEKQFSKRQEGSEKKKVSYNNIKTETNTETRSTSDATRKYYGWVGGPSHLSFFFGGGTEEFVRPLVFNRDQQRWKERQTKCTIVPSSIPSDKRRLVTTVPTWVPMQLWWWLDAPFPVCHVACIRGLIFGQGIHTRYVLSWWWWWQWCCCCWWTWRTKTTVSERMDRIGIGNVQQDKWLASPIGEMMMTWTRCLWNGGPGFNRHNTNIETRYPYCTRCDFNSICPKRTSSCGWLPRVRNLESGTPLIFVTQFNNSWFRFQFHPYSDSCQIPCSRIQHGKSSWRRTATLSVVRRETHKSHRSRVDENVLGVVHESLFLVWCLKWKNSESDFVFVITISGDPNRLILNPQCDSIPELPQRQPTRETQLYGLYSSCLPRDRTHRTNEHDNEHLSLPTLLSTCTVWWWRK